MWHDSLILKNNQARDDLFAIALHCVGFFLFRKKENKAKNIFNLNYWWQNDSTKQRTQVVKTDLPSLPVVFKLDPYITLQKKRTEGEFTTKLWHTEQHFKAQLQLVTADGFDFSKGWTKQVWELSLWTLKWTVDKKMLKGEHSTMRILKQTRQQDAERWTQHVEKDTEANCGQEAERWTQHHEKWRNC